MSAEVTSSISPDECRTGRCRLVLVLLFLSAFLSALSFFFYGYGYWAQNSHDDLTRAMVESHTFCIDRFITDPEAGVNTGDWSFYDGHYYSNKAPGASFLSALAYFPVYHIERAFFPHLTERIAFFNAWLFNLFASVIPFACAAILFFLTLRKLGFSVLRSAIFAEISVLCTPLWAYSTANWAHPFAATALLAAFYALLCADAAAVPRKRRLALSLAGFACGCAFLADYGSGAALPVFVFAVCFRFRKYAIPFFLGAIPPALVFCGYHYACFGSPFVIASFYNNPLFIESDKAGGIFGHFSTYLMLKLLVGTERGVFWSAPVLLAAIPGCVALWKRGGRFRHVMFFLIAWAFAGLVANSAFNGWHGGASVCARYLIFTLPTYCIAAAACPLDTAPRFLLFIAAAALSWLNMLAINAVTPIISGGYNPLFQTTYPCFFGDYDNIVNVSPGGVIGGGAFTDIGLLLLIAMIPPFVLFRDELNNRMSAYLRAIRLPSFRKECRSLAVLLLAGVAVFLLYPGDIIWVNDEPNLLRNALYASQDGIWCRHGLTGSFGVSYGPFPTWVYQFLLMFSQNLPTVVVLKDILFISVTLYLLYRIARVAEIHPAILFAIFFISPWIRHYSRCLWDNIFLIPISLAFILAVLSFFRSNRMPALICAAVLAVLAISVHSMAAPLAGGVLIFFLLFHRDVIRNRFFLCAATALPAAFFAGFIMLDRFHFKNPEAENTIGGAVATLWESIANLFQFTSIPTHLGFFGHYITGDVPGTARLPVLFSVFGWIVFILLAVCVIAAVADICRKQSDTAAVAELPRLALCILLAHVLFFGVISIEMHPHYHMEAVMPYILLAAYGAACIARKYRRLGPVLQFMTVPALVLSLVLAIAIHCNAGTRDFYRFGPTLAYQWRAAAAINGMLSSGTTIDLRYDPNVMPYDTYQQSLDVMREYEDIAHPKVYPDVPETEAIPVHIIPPNPPVIPAGLL